MKNILITGSEGFVGTKLQIVLKNIYGDSKIFTTDRIKIKPKTNHFIKDLTEESIQSFVDLIKPCQIDLIIHLAAAKGDFQLSEDDFYNDNVIATSNLILIAQKANIKNIIHYSTVSVYGHHNEEKNEKAGLNPNNPYGRTKLISEELLVQWQKESESNLTILRPSVIYGEDNYANLYNLLALMNKRISFTVGNGNYIKSMIAVENLIDITLYVSRKMDGIQIYNCTDEPYITLNETMEYISEIQGFKLPLIKIPKSLALLIAIPFEFLSFLMRKDLKITRERIHKYSMATDYRSNLIRSTGYHQRFETKERLQNMAKWYKKINKKK